MTHIYIYIYIYISLLLLLLLIIILLIITIIIMINPQPNLFVSSPLSRRCLTDARKRRKQATDTCTARSKPNKQ